MCFSHEALHMFLRHEPHLASWPCRSSWAQKPCILEMVHLRWLAAHAGHFRKVVIARPSDGPVVIIGLRGHVQRRSDGCWPTSLSEVHGGTVFCVHVSQSMYYCCGPIGHVLTLRTTFCVFTIQIVPHVLLLWATSRGLAMQIMFARISPTHG